MIAATADRLGRRGTIAVFLVTAAHFLSHFYQFVLPPVFGLMAVKLDIGFTELGLAITVFSVATGVSQTPAGFLVDRLGAAKLLAGGVIVLGGAVALYGFAPSYWALLPLVAVAGMANSVFHPADFAILEAVAPEGRVGRVFSWHAVSGNLGWAAAPVAMLGIASLADLETAFLVVGLAGVALGLILALNIRLLEAEAPDAASKAAKPNALEAPAAPETPAMTTPAGPKGGSFKDGMALLASRPVQMLFLFQLVYAMAFAGVRNFSVVALPAIWGTTAEVVAGALTGYLLAASFGNLAGGWLADATGKPGRVFAVSIITLSAIVASLGLWPMSAALLTTALLAAGALQGSLLPARDMLVREIAPPGQMGKLFGFTSSGLALGNAVTPAIFGWVMDNADPRLVFFGSAVCMLFALLTYVETRRQAA